ncbi:MAG TPA: caspase family protein, partial [Polyangiales bacterium]|nr:caspase family protein [Polyangiales bacterium]
VAPAAFAEPARPAVQSAQGQGYALLVGSNAGGPGQADLRYAEADTERVSDVLTALGGYPSEHVERLLHPTAAQLRAAIERMRAQVEPLSKRGVQSRFFFYYSGHARADALNLGKEQVPLSELRERIESLPTTLSIVVLDACQSGAFSRPKGAVQATDFSFNSVERLNAAGIAVVASSNERELSQESELLRSSYFTHHWLVGLRGAGDHNRDGRVTLSEAYQYAYNHTLANTAESAVGEQHATLETNLRGQDDVPLTHPAAASSRLSVPAPHEGRVLVQALPSWSVLAELDKVAGQAVTLALPPGKYAVTVRRGDQAARCSLILQDGAELLLEADQCEAIDARAAQAKGDDRPLTREEIRARRLAEQIERERISDTQNEYVVFELGLGFGVTEQDTSYLNTLKDFGFEPKESMPLRASVGLGYRLLPHLVLGVDYYNLEERSAVRERQVEQEISWAGHAFNLYAQADAAFGRRRLFNLFARLGLGMSYAWTTFDAVPKSTGFPDQSPALETTASRTEKVRQDFLRPAGFVGFGVQVMPGRFLGFQIELRYVLAQAIENELGDTHQLGGLNLIFSVRARTWE